MRAFIEMRGSSKSFVNYPDIFQPRGHEEGDGDGDDEEEGGRHESEM